MIVILILKRSSQKIKIKIIEFKIIYILNFKICNINKQSKVLFNFFTDKNVSNFIIF